MKFGLRDDEMARENTKFTSILKFYLSSFNTSDARARSNLIQNQDVGRRKNWILARKKRFRVNKYCIVNRKLSRCHFFLRKPLNFYLRNCSSTCLSCFRLFNSLASPPWPCGPGAVTSCDPTFTLVGTASAVPPPWTAWFWAIPNTKSRFWSKKN